MIRWCGQCAHIDTTVCGLYPWRFRYFRVPTSIIRLSLRCCGRSHESLSQLNRHRLYDFREPVRNNLHERSHGNAIVQLRYVARFHSDAAVTGRLTNCFFLRCTMNVDAALIGMRVLSFQSTQPDNARDHRVATGSVWLQNFAGQSSIVEDGADWCSITDFLLDGEITKRRCHSSPGIAETKHGGGHRIGDHFSAVLHKHQLLVAHTDDNLAGGVQRGDREDGRNQNETEN